MKSGYLKKFFHFIQTIFLRGFFTILPLTLTIALCAFVFRLLKVWLAPIYLIEPTFLKAIPHSEIFVMLLVILLVGLVLHLFLLQPLIHLLEAILGKIPLLRQIYFGIKQLVHALSAQDKLSFQKVVFIEFPRTGIYSLGFLTGELMPHVSPRADIIYYNVFVPTTPNPTTGYYVVVPATECTVTHMSRQEAMAIIISGGIIQPDHSMRSKQTDNIE